ncbi:MAG: ATP-binding protein [Planctomycetes bacterium]|nr:ATP-binding protein [Planctomycetota bacterium]|tara:strand:+ start:26960 stop:28291 length:1332 start_codon:yes stop_codon:yes gene_type:complete
METVFGEAQLLPSQVKDVGLKTVPVVWRSEEVINGHILLAGGSGTGKTHNIRKIMRSYLDSAQGGVRIHVFDVHDDIEIGGESDIIFSEASDVGLNPLEIDPDRHTGGVKKTIQNFINTINKTSRKLGDRQEAVLRAVMEDLYAANGFLADDPDTWSLNDGRQRSRPKKHPNIDDLYRWTFFKYKQLFMGGDSKSAAALDKVNREAQKIFRMMKDSPTPESLEKLDKIKNEAIDSYSEYVTTIKTGRELEDLLKYDSKTTLKSVLDRVGNLKDGGIFKNRSLNFNEYNPVWRYRLKHLGTEEKKMFVHFRLRELYRNALKRGLSDRIVEVIILDEANMFMDADPDNIISVMANEIRKFGTSLVCASQAFSHFTDDFIASAATKIVLGIDEMYWDKTCRQLQVKKEWLEWIRPRRSALISMKRNVMNPSDKTGRIKWFFTTLKQ